MDVEGTLLLNGTFGQDTLDVQRKGVSLMKVRATKDVEVTGGLFLKNQLVAGEVATFDDGTLGAAAEFPCYCWRIQPKSNFYCYNNCF